METLKTAFRKTGAVILGIMIVIIALPVSLFLTVLGLLVTGLAVLQARRFSRTLNEAEQAGQSPSDGVIIEQADVVNGVWQTH